MSKLPSAYIPTAALLCIVACVVGVFSYNAIWLADEVTYQFSCKADAGEIPVQSIRDVIESQNVHYLDINGRYAVHFIVQCFCGLWGRLPFAIANALAYIAFMVILCRMCKVSPHNFKGVLGIVAVSLLTFQTRMAPACQVGFVWMFALTMLVLCIFFGDRGDKPWWKVILLAALCLVAGNGQEALNIGVSGAFLIYWWRNRRQMTVAQYVMMICFGIGTLSDCLSPGTMHRADTAVDGNTTRNYVFGLVHMAIVLRATYLLIAIVLWKKFKDGLSLREIYGKDKFYWDSFILLIVFNLIIGVESNRQFFGAELIAIIISFRLLRGGSMTWIWTGVFTALMIATYVLQSELLFRSKHCLDEIGEKYVRSADGTIYIDLDRQTPLLEATHFVPQIWRHGLSDNTAWDERMLDVRLATDYGDKGSVKLVPTVLQGKENTDLGNRIIRLDGDNYLVVQSKTTPQRLFVTRKISFLGFEKAFEPVEVDIEDKQLCEGRYWRARLVSVKPYQVMKISHNELEFR